MYIGAMQGRPRLYHLLALAQRRAQIVAEAGVADLEVSAAQVGVLFVIAPDSGASVGDVAAALGLAQSAASTLAQRMERAGLIARAGDAGDGRVTRLSLTVRGARVRTEAVRRVQSLNRRLSGPFSGAEIAVVARFLEHVAALEPQA
jgi:MarR family transcriptional regulator, organic hydroperoxide resistance regulator